MCAEDAVWGPSSCRLLAGSPKCGQSARYTLAHDLLGAAHLLGYSGIVILLKHAQFDGLSLHRSGTLAGKESRDGGVMQVAREKAGRALSAAAKPTKGSSGRGLVRKPARPIPQTTGDTPVPRTSILALAGVVLVLAGCGSSKSSSSSSSTSSAASASTPAESTPSSGPFLAKFTSVSKIASTVPANGDVNPYGIVLVPTSVGKLQAGQMLISNFNAKESAKQSGQGTGTTIVQVSTAGKVSPFATIDARTLPGPCPGGVGLTTALNILPGGYVVVGSLPTTNGKSATAKYGCLIVLDSEGKAVETIASKNIQGPWDSTAKSDGSKTTLFVSNALNGGAAKGTHTIDNSTVLRIELESGEHQTPKVLSETVIANEIPWVDSAEALVLGPTGLALASNGTLYVASTQNNKILAISEAVTRTTAAAKGGTVLTEGGHLKEPLGMALAPNGNIITSNGGDGNMVEITPAGQQVAVQTADEKTGAGSLFGLAIAPEGKGIYFVDDGENTLNLLHHG
jgi:hypothetical protein